MTGYSANKIDITVRKQQHRMCYKNFMNLPKVLPIRKEL